MNNRKLITGKLGKVPIGDTSPVRIMGVVNLTSSSFYKESVRHGKNAILRTAIQMVKDGADLIDIGARSTAPYRTSEVTTERETELVSRAVRILAGKIRIPISVDTTRVRTARQALQEGASILNDPFGLAHPEGFSLAHLASNEGCSVIITAHEEKQGKVHSPMRRVNMALSKSVRLALSCGIQRRRITIDPGIGFFSDTVIGNVEWNCDVLLELEKIRRFGLPILIGVSRKSFLGLLGSGLTPENRLPGSLAATAIAVLNGAHVVRTHDVLETKQAISVASRIRYLRQKGLSQNMKKRLA